MFLTILTPTYNRGVLIKNLYNSLLRQKNHKFKDNGGKHTALNYSHQYIEGDWIFVVDSDDILTENAIDLVYEYIGKYANRKDIGAFAFLKSDYTGKILAPQLYKNDYISNVIDYRINSNVKGDQAEVYRTKIFKRFKFPVFEGEKFLGEDYLHINAAYISNTVYINKVIYLCEYMDGGLTKSGRQMRIQNPLGGMVHGSLYFSKRFKLKYRVKGMMLYICYGLFAKKTIKKLYQDVKYIKLFIVICPLGILLYYFWKIKYSTNKD